MKLPYFCVAVLLMHPILSAAELPAEVVRNLRATVGTIEFEDSYGTAFLGIAPGLVFTAAHVVPEGTDKTTLAFPDGREVPVKFLSFCRAGHDLAAFRVLDAFRHPVLPLAEDSSLRDGLAVYSVGTPFRLHPALLGSGIIGHHRPSHGIFLHTAPISSGSSGGPIVNAAGQVVGIIASEYLDETDYSAYGSGFNSSVDLASLRRFSQQIEEGVVETRRLPHLDFLSLPLKRLAANNPLRGVLSPDADRLPENLEYARGYLLDLRAETYYRLRLNSDDFDTYLLIFDNEADLLAENDDASEDTTNSALLVFAEHSGYHAAVVTSLERGETGAYTFSYEELRFRRPRTIKGTLTASDPDEQGNYFREITLRGDGRPVSAELRSEAFDAVLTVLDEDGAQLAWNDDYSLETTDARVVFDTEQGANYRLHLSTFEAGETGDFTLLISRAAKE